MIRRIRSVLARPWAYQFFFNAIGAPERSRILVRDYIHPKPGDRILEIGCGPGTIVPYLPDCEYVGFDVSPEYIAQARKRFSGRNFGRRDFAAENARSTRDNSSSDDPRGTSLPGGGELGFTGAGIARAEFICERVSQYTLPQLEYFDIVLALGILHHLDDSEALQLFQIAHDALRPGGKLVTLDGVWTSDQSRAARYLLARDRGRFIRTQDQYVKLASQVFSRTTPAIRHDLLRIPYTHLILDCMP